MSTKTTFKRIALVAVAALGLGVLSVAPSSATPSGVTVTATSGTAGLVGAASDSTTGAQISVAGLLDAGYTDSITVTFVQKSAYPATASVVPVLAFLDSTTGSLASSTTVSRAGAVKTTYGLTDSVTAGNTYVVTGTSSAGTYVGAKFALFLDSAASTTRPAGTYSYTVVVKSFSTASATTPVQTITSDVDITIAAAASASKVSSAALATAFIDATNNAAADAPVSAVATADTTVDAYIAVTLKNASGVSTGVLDTLTATVTGAGLISFDGTTYGKQISGWNATNGTATVYVRGDGTAGASSVAVSTTSGASWTKTLTFYAKAAKTITATVANPVLALGANAGAVAVSAVDANGTNWTGQAYIVASSAADALVAGSATTPVACAAWNSTDGILCPVTSITTGTAKFKVIDAATVATATSTSNEVTVTVSNAAPASVKLSFDKATYAPFEKAYIYVTPLDASGKAVAAQTAAALLATGGITSTYAFSAGSDTLTASAITTSALTGVKKYTVYMPASGTVTITATGGTALPVSGQVAVTASATVVNSSVDAATDAANEATDAANAATDAALAAADAADAATAAAQDASDAVAALSASVEKLVASLKAQITSLTNLVIKIQKKVKA